MSNRSTFKKLFRSSVCLILVLAMLLTFNVAVFAAGEDTTETTSTEQIDATGEGSGAYYDAQLDNAADSADTESYLTGFVRDNLYSDYYDKYAEYDVALPTVEVDGTAYTAATADVSKEATYEGESNVAVVKGTGDITFTVEVAQTGMYAVELKYFPIVNENGNDIEVGFSVDGKEPFEESGILNLKRVWINELIDGKISTDKVGNELLPNQIQSPEWVVKDICDAEGRYLDSYRYYLTAGTHTVTITLENGAFGLDYLKLHNDGALPTYDEYLSEAIASGAQETSQIITNSEGNAYIEAEQFTDKTDAIIQMAFDRSDAKITPYSVSTTVYNTLGGTNWAKSGNRVNWTIEVPEDGLYEISFRYRLFIPRNCL